MGPYSKEWWAERIHLIKKNAIVYAKAMLGIDPNA